MLAFRHLSDAVWLLAIWVGIGFVFRGVAEAATALSDEDTPARGWQIFLGIVTVIAGVVVLAYPVSSLGTLTLVVGIWLILIGVLEIIAAFSIRKAGNEVRTVISDAIRSR